MMNVLSLFSGIGGFDLGLERTDGFKTVAFCEIDPFCQKVLKKHWPDVPCFADIKKLGKEELGKLGKIDVVCGGFPCQPVSCAGKRKGNQDERWLWPEFYRIVCEVKPQWVLVENVPGLLSANSGRLFAGILRDLAASRYDVEWNIVSAASVGAPHLRKRVFIVAKLVNSDGFGLPECERGIATEQDSDRKEDRLSSETSSDVAYTDRTGSRSSDRDAIHEGWATCQSGRTGIQEAARWENGSAIADVGPTGTIFNSAIKRFSNWSSESVGQPEPLTKFERSDGKDVADSESKRCRDGNDSELLGSAKREIDSPTSSSGDKRELEAKPKLREVEYDFCGVAHGVSNRVDRLRALGNAIVPQCAEYVGRCVLESMEPRGGA